MSSFRALCAFAAVVLGIWGKSSAALAEGTPQAEARSHFDEGLRLVDAKRFDEAASHFQIAQRLRPHPFVLYNLGMAQAAAHRPAAAISTFKEEAKVARTRPSNSGAPPRASSDGP